MTIPFGIAAALFPATRLLGSDRSELRPKLSHRRERNKRFYPLRGRLASRTRDTPTTTSTAMRMRADDALRSEPDRPRHRSAYVRERARTRANGEIRRRGRSTSTRRIPGRGPSLGESIVEISTGRLEPTRLETIPWTDRGSFPRVIALYHSCVYYDVTC